MNNSSFHPRNIIIVLISIILIAIGYYIICSLSYNNISFFKNLNISKKPYFDLSIFLLIIVIILIGSLSCKIFDMSKNKIITFTVRKKIYSIIFRLIALYSIFLIGLWKCSEAEFGIMPTFYLVFISIVAIISKQLNFSEAKSIIYSAPNKNNKDKGLIKLVIPEQTLRFNKDNKDITAHVDKSYIIEAKIHHDNKIEGR